jgi:ATP-dependent RNA helicase RhlB
MKAGTIPLLVATDVAARGLHIDDVDLVVNYDLPEDRESYVHRIGRTARAGKSGKAVSLVCERYVYSLEGLQTFINMKIPVGQVTEDMLRQDASAGMRFARPVTAGGRGGARRDGRGDRDRGRGQRSGARGERRPAAREGGGERRPAPRETGAGKKPARASSSGQRRVSRDTPLEERAAHYREKHDRVEEATDRPRRPRSRPEGSRERPPRKDRPAQAPPPEPARPPPPPPPPAAPAHPSLVDRIRGLFRRKPRDPGGQS